MRQSRSSNKLENIKGTEIDKLSKLKEEPHLSGAYIRSLVKQLTSSKTKDSMNHHKDPTDCVVVVDGHDCDASPGQNLAKLGGEDLRQNQRSSSTQQNQHPQQHKKQVRRRLHTTRPYQERLLNMAEARREIVTALKFHRAAMKQSNEQQNQHQHQQQEQQPPPPQPQPPVMPCFEQEGKIKSRRNHRVYPSSTSANFSNYLENLPYTSDNFSHHHHHHQQPPPPNPFSWPASPIPTLPLMDNLNFPLPNQALGLNLNFKDFNNIDTSLYHTTTSNNNNNIPSSVYSASSPSISIATDHEFPGSAAMFSQAELGPPMTVFAAADFATTSGGGGRGGGGLHAAMDDEEMAEIRSIGEQHQMEWNDTMNLVTSAWWFKYLKSMELGGPSVKAKDDIDDNIDGFRPFDEVMEFPAWLSSNESCFDQQHFDDYYCSDDYFQAPALPW
ncbi:hypothetical protein PanWU01x14_059820 [Parasponia andersonii]|uniref:Hydroxyproline-rich glycoprotein family protein n=1 Tax=Parasponia andersonii TaxID=3476 RepID=A0A2P5DIM3_PARAD|nr:hypothetical protein PanWU01x14_059820 [Parasponia andersonii]